MSCPHVLVLTCDGDVHADRVRELLVRRGVRTSVFDNADYPARAHVELAYDGRGLTRRLLHTGSDTLDLDSVTTVWWRRPRPPAAHPAVTDPAVAAYTAHRQRRAVRRSPAVRAARPARVGAVVQRDPAR
ncbi:MvdC/MvdD family ATP grasp protein, partial [Nonomuraea sp. NPDC001023]|uniref:MvdC/MvdD family ATP grasp protein n=1 Tax=Nonomuraea sp. NPDC001023 TaxID=3154770 RepID=UPI003334557D